MRNVFKSDDKYKRIHPEYIRLVVIFYRKDSGNIL